MQPIQAIHQRSWAMWTIVLIVSAVTAAILYLNSIDIRYLGDTSFPHITYHHTQPQVPVISSGMKTYADPQARFTFQYPSQMTLNPHAESVYLGTAVAPVYGVGVGYSVIDILDTPMLNSLAASYMSGLTARKGGLDSGSCFAQQLSAGIEAITTYNCGGGELDGYIPGPSINVFVEGRLDTTEPILRSFRFTR
jgi:hypothetical protein